MLRSLGHIRDAAYTQSPGNSRIIMQKLTE